jgi:RHS repeat-associated protein
MTIRVAALFVFILIQIPFLHADTTFTGFTITGSPVGGSTDTYTETATISRDPNDPTIYTITISFDDGSNGVSINIPAQQSTGSITLSTGCVANSASINLHAHMTSHLTFAQTTLTATLNVSPMTASLTMTPSMFSNSTGHGTISLNATTLGNQTASFTENQGATSSYGVGQQYTINSGTNSKTFDFNPLTITIPETVTYTVFVTCANSDNKSVAFHPANTPFKRCPWCEGSGGSPINFTNGDVWIEDTDYSIPGLGGGINVSRTWNSLWTGTSPIQQVGMFGDSVISSFEERLQMLTGGSVRYWRANGDIWVFSYSTLNSTYSLDTPGNQRAFLTVDSGANQKTVTFLDGSAAVFNQAGYLIATKDRNGNQLSVTLDGSNRITSVTDAGSRTLTFNHNGASNLVASISDSTGAAATYTYDGNSRLTNVTYPDGGQLNYAYDSNGLITAVTDAGGFTLETHTYDGNRRGLTSARASGVDSITVAYTSDSLTTVTDSLSNTTTYTYMPVNGTTVVGTVTGPGCASCGGRGPITFAYGSNATRSSSTDELGHATRFTYDSDFNLASRTLSIGGTNQTYNYTYNIFGQVLTSTDPLGHVTTNGYDSHGNLLNVYAPSPDGVANGPVTTFAYDSKGQLLTITDPRGKVTTMTYSAAGLVATITDPTNAVTTFAYDARGNRTSVTDALNNQTSFSYDTRNRLTKVTYPDTTHSDFAYDTRGRRVTAADQKGNVTSYAYDDADRLSSVTDALSRAVSYTYDSENNLKTITDARGKVNGYSYDNRGRVTQATNPLGLSDTYVYDAGGNLTSKTDRNSHTINYSYDEANRLTAKSYPDSTSVNYTYDIASRLTQVVDPTGTYSFTHDNLGRQLTASTVYSFLPSRTLTITSAYDVAGNRTSMADAEGSVTHYSYDDDNRVSLISDPFTLTHTFTYDALSRRNTLTRSNRTTTWDYDSLSRITSIREQNSITSYAANTYAYDAASNRISYTNFGSPWSYVYDADSQLTRATQSFGVYGTSTSTYAYDAAGNRLDPTNTGYYVYGDSNQFQGVSSSDWTITYDNNGNPLTSSQPNGPDPIQIIYTWDTENRLTQLVNQTTYSPSNVITTTTTFRYDPFGRRIQKNSEIYVYDRANIVEDLNTSGTVTKRYVWSLNTDELLGVWHGGEDTTWLDALGSVTKLSHPGKGGQIPSANYYMDSWGNFENGTTENYYNRYRFTGREFDQETGLYYYRSRYYDPQQGRFINEDPVHFAGGVNFYQYSGNNPVNSTDPTGWSTTVAPSPPGISTWTAEEEAAYQAFARGLQGVSKLAAKIGTSVGVAIYLLDPSGSNNRRFAASKEYRFETKKPSNPNCGNDDDEDDPCWQMYQTDIDTCRKMRNSSCYEQAMKRYAACRAGKAIPPFPYRRNN